MRVFLSSLLFAVLAMSACKKSSKEFYELQHRFDVLVAEEGDDAYVSAAMGELEAGFSAIPSNAIQKPQAEKLLAKISVERARVQGERAAEERDLEAAQAAATAPSPFPNSVRPSEPAAPIAEAPPPPAVDAGEPYPFGGMSLAEFRRLFGSCIKGETTFDRGGEVVPAFPVVESSDCQRRMKAPAGSLMIFVGGKLFGTATLSAAGRATADAGPPAPTTKVVDGPSFIVVPGGPTPPGYASPPGAPIAPAPQGQGSDSLQPRKNP